MSHTNSTTNYSLPQFITTDKPAWLTDINTAFYDIDAAINNAKTAADNAQSDATQAITDAGNASTAASTADGKGSGAVSSIAEAFDATSTYSVGDYVMYNNLLYVCDVAVTTPGAWTGVTNWSRTTIDDIVTAQDASISSLSNSITSITNLTNATITNNTTNTYTALLNTMLKKNGLVTLDYTITPKALTDLKSKTWGTIPSGYIPYVSFRVTASYVPDATAVSSTTWPLIIEINNSGEIRTIGNGAYAQMPAPTTNSQISIHAIYYTV